MWQEVWLLTIETNVKGFPTYNTMYWHFLVEMDVGPIFLYQCCPLCPYESRKTHISQFFKKNRHINLVTFGTGTSIAPWTASCTDILTKVPVFYPYSLCQFVCFFVCMCFNLREPNWHVWELKLLSSISYWWNI